MGTHPWRGRLVRRSTRAARRSARMLGDAGQRLAARLAYRPREVVVVALLAAGLFGGLVIERWRMGHPALADRLEVEPARPSSPPQVRAAARARPRSMPPRCEEPPVAPVAARSDIPRLDLNRATPGELARLAGISWRLASRIVAAREVFEGRDPPRAAPDGDSAGAEPVEPSVAGTVTTEPAPDVDPP